ncbi:type VI secretion system protein [Algicola sagamiensis]|uniref:type VI secretion system protein n=1 Tax=Algicola sagamiensis TaxID=163869 RepID=UPI000377EC00|nr:type VI secretion protein IcmF/TssM N-terminal domain-containing protein [Algicola sagamiensis]
MNKQQWLDWLLQQWSAFMTWLATLFSQLEERLAPLFEKLQPLWTDPIWQALLIILILMIGSLIFFAMIQWGYMLINTMLKYVKKGLKKIAEGIKRVLLIFISPLMILSSVIKKQWRYRVVLQQRIAHVMDALRYLTTSRNWRYQSPWFLVLGEKGTHKEALISGVMQGKRSALLRKEKRLRAAGSQWHFFDEGVLIDVEDHLLDVDEGDDWKAVELRFESLLDLILSYRPERPIDGIIFAISAQSLLSADSDEQREKLIEPLYRQLWHVQKKTGFRLPVYVVVNGCESIRGFESFWQTQQESRYQEMLGWSNENRLESEFKPDWLDDVFQTVIAGLQQAQLTTAASNQDIADVDNFVLHHQYFQRLYEPLKTVISGLFTRSRFHVPMPLRGIYFSGQLYGQTTGMEHLLHHKIFREHHLASPIEYRHLSTQSTLRQFQFATIGVGIFSLVWLGVDISRMYLNNEDARRVIGQVVKRQASIEPDCSAMGIEAYSLLTHLNEVGEDPIYPSMILSYFDIQYFRNQKFVADYLLAPRLFKGMECRLNIRAQQLRDEQKKLIAQDASIRSLSTSLQSFGESLAQFQAKHDDFLELSGPMGSVRQIPKKLKGLLDYLYDAPTPESAIPRQPLITGAVKMMEYANNLEVHTHQLVSSDESIDFLENVAQQLHKTLLAEASPNLNTDLSREPGDKAILALVENISTWITGMLSRWGVPYSVSPCGHIYEALDGPLSYLASSGVYLHSRLQHVQQLFSKQQCYDVLRADLAKLQLGQFGSPFELKDNILGLSEKVISLIPAITRLASLSFVSNPIHDHPMGKGETVGWKFPEFQLIIQQLVEYQNFIDLFWPDQEEPFYGPALRGALLSSVGHHIQDAMIKQTQSREVIENVTEEVRPEAVLSRRVDEFVRVESVILRVDELLTQLGENRHRIYLKQAVRDYILAQLGALDEIIYLERLYEPIQDPVWQRPNLAFALYDVKTEKQLYTQLDAQRERFNFLALSYADPLIRYLINNESLNTVVAKRWRSTLVAIYQFQHANHQNDLSALEGLVKQRLVNTDLSNCAEVKQIDPLLNRSWFADRYLELHQVVKQHCKQQNQNNVLELFKGLAKRFNEQLAGRYPFADVKYAGKDELTIDVAIQFFEEPENDPKVLLDSLTQLQQKDPSQVPQSWISFVSQLSQFQQWIKIGKLKGKPDWAIDLSVTFDAMPQGQGADQIISWQLSDGDSKIGFPNQGNAISWGIGEPLALQLTWANSSAFQPFPGAVIPNAVIGKNKQQVTFQSQGSWGMFEWLSQYATVGVSQQSLAQSSGQMFTFAVPVGLKQVIPLQKQISYISQPSIAIQANYLDKNGRRQSVQWPFNLPHQAPRGIQ